MKISQGSKLLLPAICLTFFAMTARADNILANGDFADGKAHWKGDGKDANTTDMTDISASLSNQDAAHGMAVTLSSKVTSVSQVFNTRETDLVLSITYKTSADFSPIGQGGLQDAVQSLLGFRAQRPVGMRPGYALVLIADPMQNEVIYTYIDLPASATDAKTITAPINGLMAHEEKTLCIAFPSGSGTITFSNISLDKPAAPSAPATPFHN